MTDTTTQVEEGDTAPADTTPHEGTVLEGKDTPPVPQDWPDDWRNRMAGGDEKLMKQLEKLSSPQDLYKSYRALQSKLTSGEYKKPAQLSDNPTEEELSAFRKENGIPEKWEDYDLELPDGLVIGEDDMPIVQEVLKGLHEANAPAPFVKAALSTYFKVQEAQRSAAAENDEQINGETVETLRAEWGAEYVRNKNAISSYIGALGEFGELLAGARLADGTKLLGTVEGVKFIHDLAKEANPATTAFPGSSDPVKSIEQEITSLGVGTEEYWKSPQKQARFRELLDMQEKIAAK